MPNRPKLIVQPNVITKLDASIWLTFIYKNGPPHSMAMIRVNEVNSGAYQILNVGIPY
jgi:hypothetical protein